MATNISKTIKNASWCGKDVMPAPASSRCSAATIRLSQEHLGLARISQNPSGAIELAEELLQKNHDENHIFWRDVGGHNHIPHSVLTILALGGGPAEIRRAYDDGIDTQRPIPEFDEAAVEALHNPEIFRRHMGDPSHYANYRIFFEQQIALKGSRQVLEEYLFTQNPISNTLFAQLYEGAYHPLIHLGFGVEFELPSIIAEGLAQAAIHDSAGLEDFFTDCERTANREDLDQEFSLLELYGNTRTNLKLRHAARLSDGPVRVRDGVMGRAKEEMTSVAAKFRIRATPDCLARRCAEMINMAAYSAGGAQRVDKARKIDFFQMHSVNASIFLTSLLQKHWISLETKVRLIECKARTDLVWYAASAAAELRLDYVENYQPTYSKNLTWSGLYDAVCLAHDDGHVAKFIRAIRNGEEVCRQYETGDGAENFPIKGGMWLQLAQMAYDTTISQIPDDKWIWGAGFDPLWFQIPAIATPIVATECRTLAPALVQRATLDRFLAGWSSLSSEEMIATFSPDYTQTTLPYSIGIPARTREQVQATLPLIHQAIKDYKLVVHEIIHDVTQGKAIIYASSQMQTSFGDSNNEYAVFLTFSKCGEKIVSIKEMLDTAVLMDFFPKLMEHLHEMFAP